VIVRGRKTRLFLGAHLYPKDFRKREENTGPADWARDFFGKRGFVGGVWGGGGGAGKINQ